MNILHVVPSYYPAVRYGGPIYSVHALAAALVKQNHNVEVFTTNVDGPMDSDVPIDRPVNLDGVTVRYYRTNLSRRLYHSTDMRHAIHDHIKKFDVVHLHSVFLWPTTAAARIARDYRVPYVISPRGMLVPDLIRRKNQILKRTWITLFERINVERAAALHLTSEIEARDIALLGLKARRLSIISNGIEQPATPGPFERATSEGTSSEPSTILFLGRISWKKGLDRLIPAMSSINRGELVVAGNDEEDYLPTLRKLAETCGVSHRVRFIGPVAGSEKWALLRKARMLVLPSYSENFGNVVLEAMAVGCPVVITPEVGLASAVQTASAGVVVEGLPDKIAAEINNLLDSPETARRMGERGRRLAEDQFSWGAIAQEMTKLYHRCTDGCPGA
jgi:glycosyltransferase involved in cell wall biosynthesis